MSNKDKFEKDSIEELKKIMDTPEYKAEQRRMIDEIFLLGETKSNTIVFDSDNYNKPLTIKRMMETFDRLFEGATDDNHRFKFTEK